jgi:hypothetical protein
LPDLYFPRNTKDQSSLNAGFRFVIAGGLDASKAFADVDAEDLLIVFVADEIKRKVWLDEPVMFHLEFIRNASSDDSFRISRWVLSTGTELQPQGGSNGVPAEAKQEQGGMSLSIRSFNDRANTPVAVDVVASFNANSEFVAAVYTSAPQESGDRVLFVRVLFLFLGVAG